MGAVTHITGDRKESGGATPKDPLPVTHFLHLMSTIVYSFLLGIYQRYFIADGLWGDFT